MAAPDLAAEVAEQLAPAYPGTYESAVVAAMLAPLQRMANVILDDDGAYATVFDRTIDDATVLPWGAQWAGRHDDDATEDELRDVDWVRRRWARGSLPAIRAAVAAVLTGSKHVRIYERTDPADYGVDEPYHLTIITTTAETPGGVDSVVDAVRDVLPARIVLHALVVAGQDLLAVDEGYATLSAVDAAYATLNDVANDTP